MFDNSRLLGVEVQSARSVSGTLKRLGGYFRPYRWVLVVVMALIIIGTLMQTVVPSLQGQAVDCYLGPFAQDMVDGDTAAFDNCWYTTPDSTATAAETLRGFGFLILIILALYIGGAVVGGMQFYLMARAGLQVLRDLRVEIFQHIHRLSLSYFTKNEAGDVMSRVTNDIDTLQQVISFGLIQVVQGILLMVFIVVAMLIMSIPLALITLITVPLMFYATRFFSTQARRAFRQARQEIGAVNSDLQESISAVREVQAFSREDENIEQFRMSNAANRDANIKAQAYSSALAPALEALSYVSLALVAAVGGIWILREQTLFGTAVSVGLIVTFIAFSQQFNRPVQQIAVLWTNLQSAIAGVERIFELLDEVPDLTDQETAAEMPPIEGHVQFKKVWAEYNPGEPILRDIDIEAKPGEMIAIVGPTGAGKTTIINLIPRFWDVTEGSVLIDGHDVRDVTRKSLRSQIGIVLQDTFLFSDTVMNNIRYGRQGASDEEVITAAQLARADDFISKLPNGYETVLGERGAGLSQGQRQLIAIARVILANPRLLILDEATSSVDTRTEREIQKALDRLLEGRTSFVIAHRLSTIRNADQLLFVKAGEILERGQHEELLALQGHYYDLYMSQFRREEESPSTAD